MSKEIIFLSIPRAFEPPCRGASQLTCLKALRHFFTKMKKLSCFQRTTRVQKLLKLYRCHMSLPLKSVDEPKPPISPSIRTLCNITIRNTYSLYFSIQTSFLDKISLIWLKKLLKNTKVNDGFLAQCKCSTPPEKMSLSNLTRKTQKKWCYPKS